LKLVYTHICVTQYTSTHSFVLHRICVHTNLCHTVHHYIQICITQYKCTHRNVSYRITVRNEFCCNRCQHIPYSLCASPLSFTVFTLIFADKTPCRFGLQNCTLRCHCKDDALCHPFTGECPAGCHDDGTPLSMWHGPGCQIGRFQIQINIDI